MDITTTISFAIEPFEGTHAATPILDGISLVELVSAFERKMGFDVVGGYGGLIPQWFNYGSLNRYFLGDFEPDSFFAKKGGIYLLGCDCGEVGCWPLSARLETDNHNVKWVEFRQEHRPQWDYLGFGPFVFDKDQYKQAVAMLRDELSAFSSSSCT
jgi:hypothetical protein